MSRLDRVARRYARAVRERDAARDALAEAVRAACDAGMTEKDAAQAAGVSRLTVRSWRGK